ncbi:MAG: hypothetical protein CMG55_05280 [Candidatus Marinimicrobia bacterium]|nr:hypothetical protein [Candidatus Neomarinimicrobiota bacterium]|tara:strand:+ start:3530 stop:5368 length:1839 start_codon:yes stop_codon:yes gene_type:complete
MIKLVPLFIFLFQSTIIAVETDQKSYYQKFNQAVEYYKEGRYQLAESVFKNILKNDRDYRDPASQLLIAKSQNQQGLWGEARRTCKAILANYPGSPYEFDTYLLLGDCALNEGKVSQAFKNYIIARPLIKDLSFINEIDQRLYNCIALGLKEENIEGILFRERNIFNRTIINLARAYQAWIKGDNYAVEFILNDIDTYYLPGKFSKLYGNLLKLEKEYVNGPTTIGVIIPLSGNKKDMGSSYLLGLSESLEVPLIRFIIYDSAGLGINSLKIVKDINKNNLISAILGPLTNEEIYTIAGTNLNIPILVPNNAPVGISDLNENIFFLSPSFKTMAERTAQMIIKELGYKTIAVLSPGDGHNKLITDYFLNECHQLGIDPIAIEWYIDKPINLSRQLKNIRKKAWELIPKEDESSDFVNLEIDSLDALFDVDVKDFFALPKEEDEKMDKKDSSKVELATIQALYIPIRPNELTYVGTQLPFYNLKTSIFGNKNWLDMKLLNQEVIGPHVQGMHIITDVNSVEDFNDGDVFIHYYNISKEHVKYLEQIIKKGSNNRKHFLKTLKINKEYYGEKLSIGFSGKNKNENILAQVLQYSNKNIKNVGMYDGVIFKYKIK